MSWLIADEMKSFCRMVGAGFKSREKSGKLMINVAPPAPHRDGVRTGPVDDDSSWMVLL